MVRENIEMRTICADKTLTVLVEKAQIEQVIMNLSTNACDAMPKGGRLVIATGEMEVKEDFVEKIGYGKPGKYAQLSVTDTGTGIDEQIIDSVFDPFFTTKERGKGTGLGLSIVYGIVRKHEGYIAVDSKTDKGTTVSVLLPIAGPDDAAAKKTEQLLSPPPAGTETILLAEDEPGIRKLLSSILSRHGYRVIGAVDGEDALVKFTESKVELTWSYSTASCRKKTARKYFKKSEASRRRRK